MAGLLLLAQTVSDPIGAQPDMLEARQMQALSLAVHIPIVCFGIAFPAMFLFIEGLYLRTGDLTYKALAKRWSKVALILFAVGVVTGTILSFEFGLLWPQFMATFGEVFGIAFALEGISFFVEAIFIAIYVYGWDRLSPKGHFWTGVPVVISGFAGSFNVIAVNGWMNEPTGFTIVGGIYALAWLRGERGLYVRTALVVALAFASLAAPVQVLVGDWAGREVAKRQPTKLAAFEGLQETTKGAPFTLGGFYSESEGRVKYGIEIPRMLSLLAKHNPNAVIQGLDAVPPRDRP